VAECPALNSCYAQGETYEEAIAHIKGAITNCLAALRAKKLPVPHQLEIISIRWVEVTG
jgi:predicted RNase H-like HicB family nuclease